MEFHWEIIEMKIIIDLLNYYLNVIAEWTQFNEFKYWWDNCHTSFDVIDWLSLWLDIWILSLMPD